MAWNTAYDLDSLMVNTKAATVYAAHENSLFLGGGMVPAVQLPAGSITAQVPVMGKVTAQKLTSAAHNVEDFNALGITDTKVTIEADIYAARDVIRDLGGVNPEELGRVLGNSIVEAFDTDVFTAMNGLNNAAGTGISVDRLIDAAAEIRANGETGALKCIMHPTHAASLMKDIGTQSYAGGDFQSAAMTNGFLGTVAGIAMFQSSRIDPSLRYGYVFADDAMRIAMFKNVDLEAQRRAEAVGTDIVASLHAGVGVVDAERGLELGL